MNKFILAILCVASVGCTRVHQGELGIISHLGGGVADEAAHPGFNMTVLDSIQCVDATEVRVSRMGITPKDKDGVLVTTNVLATYRINPDKAIAFYKQTHEIDDVKENESVIHVLGYQVLEQEITNATQKAFSEFLVSDMVPKKAEMEARLKAILQEKLDKRYADAFLVNNVNINETRLGDAVESVLQAQAIAKSQRQLLELQQQLAEKESELILKKMEGLKSISTKTGIPVDRLIEFKLREQYNNVLSELAKSHGNTQIQVKSDGK